MSTEAPSAAAHDVRVVVAAPDDWPRHRALRLRALAEAPDAFCGTLADEAARPDAYWRARLTRPNTRALRVERRGDDGAWSDAGLAELAPAEGSSAPDATGLYSVWIAPEARGRGAGAALVAAALELARSDGARRVVLDVGIGNGRARRVYERAGFRATGRVFTLAPPRDHQIEEELAVDLVAP